MKKVLALLAILLLLCACGKKQEVPLPDSVDEPNAAVVPEVEPENPPTGFQENAGKLVYIDPQTEEVATFEPGLAEIEGGTYWIQADGMTILTAPGLQTAEDGTVVYVGIDGTLHFLPEGILDLDGTLYWNAAEGYCFQPAEEGLRWTGDALYDIQADGSLLTDAADGYLYFGADGKYTSGNADLDAAVMTMIADNGGDSGDPETILRSCYNYFRDHYTYLSMAHQPAGSTDWAEDCAVTFFDMTKGNCYCWAAAVMYVARQLGYQAYVVAGWEYSSSNEHAWTMIDWPDGETYLFDAQLEYAYIFQYKRGSINMFKIASSGYGVYNGKQYYFPKNA